MFNFKIQNIDTKYDVNVNITHTDYNYRNIIFFTYLYNDSLLIQKDTINIDIYNKYGKTKGKGMSGVKKISSNIYKNHLFKNIGFHNIHIEQAFRVGQKNRIDSLGSLYSFGLEVINNKDED
jgi:gliding motility-associated lipoprotein GldH